MTEPEPEPEAKPEEPAAQTKGKGGEASAGKNGARLPAQATGALSRVADVLAFLSAFVPAAIAMTCADNTRDYAHDLSLLRSTVAAGTGLFRALDAFAYAPFLLVPLGTAVFRLSLASALFAGAAGLFVYSFSRKLYDGLFGARWHCVYLAFIASQVATLSAPFLYEASTPAGSCLGALLALGPLFLLTHARSLSEDASRGKMRFARFAGVVAALGLAVFYEPLVGLAALGSVLPFAGNALLSPKAWRARAPIFTAAFALGLIPPVALFVRVRFSALAILTAPIAPEPFGEAATSGAGSPASFFRSEVGPLLGALVVLGLVLALRKKSSRVLASSLGLVVLAAALGVALGAPTEAPRFGAVVLAGLCAAGAFIGVALGHIVDFVSEADIPFAKASAAMIVVFELVLPVRQADDALTRRDARSRIATPLLETAVWAGLDPGTVIVTSEPSALVRTLAARESGTLRSDVIIAPTFDLTSALVREALSVEPLLAGVYRDVALGGRPEEFALSELSRARPLSLAFDPTWDRSLARHLVSAGITTVFEAEPRGASDRIARIEAFTPLRQKLVVNLLPKERDPQRLYIAIKGLRTRAIALGAGGERLVLAKALDDLRALSPEDPIADKLTRRIVTAHGPIDVRDLSP